MRGEKIELTEKEKSFVLDEVLKGTSIVRICQQLGISERGFFDYRKRDPLFSKDFAELRAEWAHAEVERLRTIADNCYTMEQVQRARLQSDNIKWEVSKRVPDVYGDSINVNMNHSIDLSKVMIDAAARVSPILMAKQPMISGQVVETIDSPASPVDAKETEVIEIASEAVKNNAD